MGVGKGFGSHGAAVKQVPAPKARNHCTADTLDLGAGTVSNAEPNGQPHPGHLQGRRFAV